MALPQEGDHQQNAGEHAGTLPLVFAFAFLPTPLQPACQPACLSACLPACCASLPSPPPSAPNGAPACFPSHASPAAEVPAAVLRRRGCGADYGGGDGGLLSVGGLREVHNRWGGCWLLPPAAAGAAIADAAAVDGTSSACSLGLQQRSVSYSPAHPSTVCSCRRAASAGRGAACSAAEGVQAEGPGEAGQLRCVFLEALFSGGVMHTSALPLAGGADGAKRLPAAAPLSNPCAAPHPLLSCRRQHAAVRAAADREGADRRRGGAHRLPGARRQRRQLNARCSRGGGGSSDDAGVSAAATSLDRSSGVRARRPPAHATRSPLLAHISAHAPPH